MLQVFLLHYFASHDLVEYVWVLRGAVPTFILISAYLYGIKNEKQDRIFGYSFLKERFIKLSVPYYIFLLCVYSFWCISDPKMIGSYTISLISELLYLTDFGSIVKPLPNCGHLYFLQLIMMCYLLLFFLNQTNMLKRGKGIWSNRWWIAVFFMALLISGLFFKRLYFIVAFFYLLVYYNADSIKKQAERINVYALVFLIVVSYIVYYFIKCHEGAYPAFLFQIWGYIVGLLVIMLFEKCFRALPESRVIVFLSSMLMEFYLVHHLFVFDYPLYISFAVSLLLSFILSKVSFFVLGKIS